ncbi:hypothetical protein BD779DRAFT_1533544 [Infundibulicybe gibba]|nr:hypothetical protein BD779DRAFT_1533544 [Infundibulicybe gibba]
MPSYFITGSSRGIGFAIVEELLKDKNNFVIASARSPQTATGLQDLAKKFPKEQLAIVQFDITDYESIKRGAAEATALCPNGLDYLINNAGVNYQAEATFENMDVELFAKEMRNNTVVPVQIGNAFLPLIRKSQAKKLVFVSSELGSLELGGHLPGLANAYSVSKAALNMLARKWGASLKKEGITTIVLHPGWVHTDIGDTINEWVKEFAPHMLDGKLTAQQSAQGTLNAIHAAKLEDATQFWNFDLTFKPW